MACRTAAAYTVSLNVTVAHSREVHRRSVDARHGVNRPFTVETHDAHDMPSIPNSVGMGDAVDFSILDMAVMDDPL
ncbi:hypothetical protein BS630_35805 [Rhizobium laguerreae]|nr:hypothetical protein BS630_35805 [Rhizobium laguerreae]